jgi:hypothetical protein
VKSTTEAPDFYHQRRNGMNIPAKLVKLREEFTSDDGVYTERWRAIEMLHRWCILTGHYQSREAVERFMCFVEGREYEP